MAAVETAVVPMTVLVEQYPLPDRKLMKVAQYRCYVVKLPGTDHNTCRRTLDRLKLLPQTVTDAVYS